jgi:hypothetical protein
MPEGKDTHRDGSSRLGRTAAEHLVDNPHTVPTPQATGYGVYADAPLPEGHDHTTQHAWGGRAIFRGGRLDLPQDRHGTAGPEEGRSDFQKLVGAALPSARERARAVEDKLTDTRDWHVLHSDENVTIHGNARGQMNNYLHLSAFRTPEGGVQPVAQSQLEMRDARNAKEAAERAAWRAQREAEGN